MGISIDLRDEDISRMRICISQLFIGGSKVLQKKFQVNTEAWTFNYSTNFAMSAIPTYRL